MDVKVNETAEKVNATLVEIERAYSASPYVSSIFAAFVLSLAHKTPEETELKAILLANKVSAAVMKTVMERIGDHWDRYRPMLTSFSSLDLADFFSNMVSGDRLDGCRGSRCSSSLPIVDLVIRILDLKKGLSVCDLGCAVGDFLAAACSAVGIEGYESACAGIEIDPDLATVAAIRMQCEGLNASIRNDSVFAEKHTKVKFDRVFCDAPLAMRGLAQEDAVKAFIRTSFPDFPELNPMMTGDWLFAARAVAAMKKDGRAVAILSPSAMFDGRNAPYRRYFIQRNLIEAVIELPPRLFAHTNLSVYLVVFSEGNECVQMVRTNDLYYQNRKSNILGSTHVNTIAACVGLGNQAGLDGYRVSIPKDELLVGECDLTVARHFAEPEPDDDAIPFKALIAEAKRGFALSSRELDAKVGAGSVLYLAPGDISEGVLPADVTQLKELPKGAQPFVAKRGDLVMTRTMTSGAAFKTAVVERADGMMVLPNGNLLLIAVDPEKADPYFIKAWLDGEFAQRYLARFSTGSASRILGFKVLEDLPIPALPLDQQRKIGAACRAAVERFVRLRDEKDAAKAALDRVFEDFVKTI